MQADYPRELRLHGVTVDRIEASNNYPGRFVAFLSLDGLPDQKFWCSEKQARSLQRVQYKEKAYAVIEYGNPKGPRFVFASDNATWLHGAFIDKAQQAAPAPVAPLVQTMPEPKFMSEDDLPF